MRERKEGTIQMKEIGGDLPIDSIKEASTQEDVMCVWGQLKPS